MGATIAEKIIARAAGLDSVKPYQMLELRPDYMVAYDFPGYTDKWFKQLRDDFKLSNFRYADKTILFIDHMTTRKDDNELDYHNITRRWAFENNVRLIEGKGIGHQVISELGCNLPGKLLVHFDGHMSIVGAFSALGWGIRNDFIEPLVTGKVLLEVPESTLIKLTGDYREYVNSRDLIHHIIKSYGPDCCINRIIEYSGPGARTMNLDQRQSLCSLAMFTGAVSSIFDPDEELRSWIENHTSIGYLPAINSDEDAEYSDELRVDLSTIEPMVVLPGSSTARNTYTVRETTGITINRGFIGSCASGRLDDIRAAATVLNNRKIASGFKLVVSPSSEIIREKAEQEGLLEVLRAAGAIMGNHYCDYCYGYSDPLADTDKCISTGVLNIPGRMGSVESEIYLANAYTVAATALTGRLTNPASVLKESEIKGKKNGI